MRSPLALCALALSVLLFAGCTEKSSFTQLGPAGVLDPPPPEMEIAGQWSTTSTEVLDTCGFDPLPALAPLMIEEGGTSVVFTFSDPQGFCERSARTRSGDVVYLSRTDTLEACGGTVMVQSSMTYSFTENGFVGSSEHVYSNLTGECANLPCEYRMNVSGLRCEDCWPGCWEASAASKTNAPSLSSAPNLY